MLFRASPRNCVEQNSLPPPIGPRFLSSSSVSVASCSLFLFLSFFSVSTTELPSPSSKDRCIFKLRNLSPINLVCSPSHSSSAFLHLMLSSSARKRRRRMSSIGTKGGHGKLKSSKSVSRCLEEGAEEFIVKPVKPSDLKRLKDYLVGKKVVDLVGEGIQAQSCKRKLPSSPLSPSPSSSSLLPCNDLDVIPPASPSSSQPPQKLARLDS
ncbi:Two-component response regulator [Nymphaea thermarum]|nr:Two-component response regulator [Nymphaea thermarum]